LWAVSFCLERETLFESPAFVASGVLLWALGEYFSRTGHRGLIYHHMDLLTDHLDRRMAAELPREQRNDTVEG
jgi:hypothetical protein